MQLQSVTRAEQLRAARPVALSVLAENIPAELTIRPQWVLWRYEWREGKWTKPPFDRHGSLASSTDPDTWGEFEATLAVYRIGGWDGIGYAPTPEERLTAGDADKCRDPVTGTVTGDDAAALLELDSYTEVSPSAKGLRAFAFGRKPGRASKKGGFELYDGLTREGKPGGRFLTVTGHRLNDSPATINRRQAEIDRIYSRYWPVKAAGPPAASAPLDLTDEDILRRAFACPKTGAKVQALFEGDTAGYASQSNADQALCNHLAFWFRKDAAAIDRVFRSSKLYREKWERESYRAPTIANGIESVQDDGYEPARPTAKILFNGQSIGNGKHEPAVAGDLAPITPLSPAPVSPRWPDPIGAEAFHGLAGKFVAVVEPASEADPVALLTQFLVAVGNAAGRKRFATVEGDHHHLNEFMVLVGRSAKGRKGTSWGG